MSYYSNYEGYKPLFCKSDDDDTPMMSRERHPPPRHYQDEWNQPYQSRSWNDEPSITKEIEQPEMSNLERLLKEAIEHVERQSREWDDVLDWNIESNQERPYDTFTNATEHLDDVEAIEHNDYYPNIDVTYSSNIVFQDDSEDETDEEEEENEVTNYPHETSQIVLQDSYMLEPEVTKDAIVDYDADIKELQGLMGINDHDLDELVKRGVGDDLILEVEFENLYRASSSQVLEVDRLATLEWSSECVHLNHVEKPPDYLCILAKEIFEDVRLTSHSYLKVAIIRIIIIPLKKWTCYFHITSFSWRMFYRNEKTKEDILLCEYDEKGGGSMIEDCL